MRYFIFRILSCVSPGVISTFLGDSEGGDVLAIEDLEVPAFFDQKNLQSGLLHEAVVRVIEPLQRRELRESLPHHLAVRNLVLAEVQLLEPHAGQGPALLESVLPANQFGQVVQVIDSL